MIDTISFVKQKVNLQSYSSSASYIGYFQHVDRGITPFEHMEQVVNYFYSNIFSSFPIELVTSLFTEIDDLRTTYEVTSETIRKRVTPLASLGWLSLVDYRKYYTEEAWDKIWNSFRSFPDIPKSDLSLLLSTVMTVPGIKGHCFFVNRYYEFIIYPHEDMGFGVVAKKGSKGYEIGRRFLESVDPENFKWETV